MYVQMYTQRNVRVVEHITGSLTKLGQTRNVKISKHKNDCVLVESGYWQLLLLVCSACDFAGLWRLLCSIHSSGGGP